MTFRLRTVEFTADGRRIARDRDFDTPRVTIGRSADNDIYLPDLALDLFHATLEETGDHVAVAAVGTLGFAFNGRSVLRAEIQPAVGGELRFGSYSIGVLAEPDGATLLTVERARPVPEATEAKRAFSLAARVPSRRAMSWALVLLVLGLFIALPLTSSLSREPTDKRPVAGDAAWSTGKLSRAHHALEQRCEACHVRPFEPVADKACLSCHQEIRDHAAPARISVARGEPGAGGKVLWAVAHAFGKPGPGACTDCHTEHESETRMQPAAQQFCADCHDGLQSRLETTKLGDAADFGTLHPQFRAMIPTRLGSGALSRLSLSDRPRENSGLRFTHVLHLDRRGAVARMAGTLGNPGGMACGDCHRPTKDGVRFQPIAMERDCQGCHSLAFDRAGGAVRQLRHGDVRGMMADLGASRLTADPLAAARRRPGEFASGGPYSARFGPRSGGLAAQALSSGGICGECHIPSKGGRLSVMPVTQVSRFLAHGWFDHATHRDEPCATCHAAEKSRTSADVLLPGIGQCRTCHAGEDNRAAEVPSSCSMCHRYHLMPTAPRGAKPHRS